MKRENLFNALDGLFAYDNGATDSGIKDDALKKEVSDYLKNQCNGRTTYPDILVAFVNKHYSKPPYGPEDARAFRDWVENDLYGF